MTRACLALSHVSGVVIIEAPVPCLVAAHVIVFRAIDVARSDCRVVTNAQRSAANRAPQIAVDIASIAARTMIAVCKWT